MMFPILTPTERRKKNFESHRLVKTGDPEIRQELADVGSFPPYCDRNGEVVLGYCRRCGGGEVELEEKSCVERLLVRAVEADAKLPPLERAINAMRQRRSWVVAEATMNDDASPNGRTAEQARELLSRVAPEFVVLDELERRIALGEARSTTEHWERDERYVGEVEAHTDEGGTIGEAAARSLLRICLRQLARNAGEYVAPDGTTRKTHYRKNARGEQPWDTAVRLGWGAAFAAANVLKYLRRDKDDAHSRKSVGVYYDWLNKLVVRQRGTGAGDAVDVLNALDDELTSEERAVAHEGLEA